MFHKAIVIAAIAVTASATGLVRDGPIVMKRELLARQTETAVPTGADDTCLTALLSIYSAVPTPPPELVSYEATMSITDPCSFSIPKSLESAFSSYEDEIESFYSAHSSEIDSALSECPEYSSYATETDDISVSDACATASSGDSSTTDKSTVKSTSATTTGSSGATAAASSSGASAASSSVSGNAGPRETGFVAAAVAAAGFLGVVAAL